MSNLNYSAERLKELLELIDKLLKENPNWRVGQTIFNAIMILDSDLANKIRGTRLDPYYKDILISSIEDVVVYIFDEIAYIMEE